MMGVGNIHLPHSLVFFFGCSVWEAAFAVVSVLFDTPLPWWSGCFCFLGAWVCVWLAGRREKENTSMF
jgi:hypothetical protein